MEIQQLTQTVMANLPPTSGDPSSAEPMKSPSKPPDPLSRTGSFKNLTVLLGTDEDPEFRRIVFGLDETEHARRLLARWAERWVKRASMATRDGKTRWMAVCGPPGTGKTHTLNRAFSFLRSHSVDLWPKWWVQGPPKPIKAIWSKAVAYERLSWADFEQEVHESKFVFLDDVGSEIDRFKTGESAERLRLILDLCENKWLFITSNLSREAFGRAFDSRIQSRLERAVVMEMKAIDYRTKLRGTQE